MRYLLLSLLAGLLLLAAPARAEEAAAAKDQPKAQTTCPVMGGAINKEIFADYEGKRVYFCCQGCVDTFKKDPAKYVEKLEKDGVTLDKVCACGHVKGSDECKKACQEGKCTEEGCKEGCGDGCKTGCCGDAAKAESGAGKACPAEKPAEKVGGCCGG